MSSAACQRWGRAAHTACCPTAVATLASAAADAPRNAAHAATRLLRCLHRHLARQEDVVGLRTPYLDTDTAVREVLHQNGFLYEAALIEDCEPGRGWGRSRWLVGRGWVHLEG